MAPFLLALLLLAAGLPASATEWVPIGPPGGDARSLAFDPKRPEIVYAGTSDGVLYRSDDGGESWQRLSPGFPRRGCSLDEIIVDDQGRLLVAYWEVAGAGGGVARSEDGGHTFTLLPGITGESVRALAVSPGRPDVIVAGALSGVFRSLDAGASWQRITPLDHADLRNFESVAIDPSDAGVIYAGTWHLPWKTIDGGRAWRPMKAGMIDDSDVFTLTVDRRQPATIYGTACSGIYRSADGGDHWAKIRGIPSSSRRTRAFVQHPAHPEVFFAGTTEGLWRSDDDTRTWRLVTDKDLVVNTISVLPDGRILAGCDGAGILRSADRGETWAAANEGFSERFISQVVFDAASERVLAAVREDRRYGGVFAAASAGGRWMRLAAGLEGREVFALARVDGALLAGTDDGVFRLAASSESSSASPAAEPTWQRIAIIFRGLDLHPRVADIAVRAPSTVFAATSAGLLRSPDGGRTWERVDTGIEGTSDAVTAAAHGTVYAANSVSLFRSGDGVSFERVSSVPAPVHRLVLVADPTSERLLVATTEGLFEASGGGKLWRLYSRGLPNSDIAALDIAAGGRTLVASDFRDGGLYRSDDAGATWRPLPVNGLRSPRLWTIALDPRDPDRLLGAAVTGGLHRYEPVPADAAAAGR
jgi:photosystem II stability/assembly factor-like uncharacterized protein